jgi:hypothetical protein
MNIANDAGLFWSAWRVRVALGMMQGGKSTVSAQAAI